MAPASQPSRSAPADRPATWLLQDAKARLSELVRMAGTAGPQRITVHGREAAVVISPEEYRRLTGRQTGQALIDAMRACPEPGFEFAPERMTMAVRDVAL